MVNAVADHSCIFDSSTGTLTLRGFGSINFSALLKEVKQTADMLDPGQRITLGPGQLRSGGIASEFPSVFDRRKAAQNMALGRVLWEKIITRFSEENSIL